MQTGLRGSSFLDDFTGSIQFHWFPKVDRYCSHQPEFEEFYKGNIVLSLDLRVFNNEFRQECSDCQRNPEKSIQKH